MIKKYFKIGYVYKAISYKLWVWIYGRKFKKLGRNTFIDSPLKIDGIKNISIGDNVKIAYKGWIAALPLTNEAECQLKIDDGCVIGNFNHIYATRKIVLGKKVLTADKVYISDNSHGFENILIAILDQPIIQKAEVTIGDGCWIGENVCIIGASIGRNSVIGANSVVTKDIPAYSVAVGIPAKVIKRYSFETHVWQKTDVYGNFIK